MVNRSTWDHYRKLSLVCIILSFSYHFLTESNFFWYVVGIEWGSDRSHPIVEAKGESFKRLAGDPKEGVKKGQMAHSLRSLGSAALNYGMVAQGGMDFYWYDPFQYLMQFTVFTPFFGV